MSARARKLVYVGMTADLLHAGHLNVLERAAEIGTVVVGLLSDAGVAEFKRVPLVPWDERARLVGALKGVDRVVRQETLADVVGNLRRLRPDVLVHGDDWRAPGVLHETRALVLRTLAEWGGELVEVPYTPGVSSTRLHERLEACGPTPDRRARALGELLEAGVFLRAAGVGGATTARAADAARGLHAVWLGPREPDAREGLTDLARGARGGLDALDPVLRSTAKPILVDLGPGRPADLARRGAELELRGASAVVCRAADAVSAVRAARRTAHFRVLARVAPGDADTALCAGADGLLLDLGGDTDGSLEAAAGGAGALRFAVLRDADPGETALRAAGLRGAVWPDRLPRAAEEAARAACARLVEPR